MIAEMTAEEVVTNMLSSNEILKRSENNFYISTPSDLGEFLSSLPEEEGESCVNRTPTPAIPLGDGVNKYTFIKEGGWNF